MMMTVGLTLARVKIVKMAYILFLKTTSHTH